MIRGKKTSLDVRSCNFCLAYYFESKFCKEQNDCMKSNLSVLSEHSCVH